MASLYLRKLDFTAAEPLLKECLKTRKAILGESHADTLLTMCKLGDLYAQRQQWNEAEHYYLLVLEYRKKDPGLQHLQTMDIISSLTTIYDSQKRYTDSEGYYILLLAFRENYFGKYHLETKNTRKKLANVKSNMGKNAEAEMLIKINTETYVDGDEVTPGQGITKMSSQRVVSARRSITQDMVKETEVVDFRNLGNIYLKQGKIQEAKLAYSKGLDLARVKLGPLHKYVFILTYELGQCLDKLGEQESAQSIYEISIKNSEVGTDQDIFDTNALVDESIYYISDIKISLSLYYNSQKRYQESKLLCAQAHAGFLSVKGKTHLNTLHAMINLADVHFNLNEIHKAEEIYVECAQDLKDTVGSEHPSTVTALTGIYSCVQKIPEKAEPILLELIDIKKKVSGYADVEVFTLLSNLGFVYVKLRQYDKAEEAYKECIDKSTETMGATYDVNIKARINLMKLYKMQNRQEEYLVLKASSPDSALSPS